MATFKRLEVWTEVAAGSGARVAAFEPTDLASAVLKTSLAGTEELTFSTARGFTKTSELVHGRIVRACWSDTSLDTEWRISDIQDQSGQGDSGQLVVTAQALYLDLARAPYFAFDSAGRPTFDFSATQLTATQWLAYAVTACTKAPLPYTVAVGTVDFTNTFDLTGDFSTALEIVRAIQQPGRAPGDFYFRRNGSTDYKLDILASRGSTASTVRVQTSKNLLANVRKRSLSTLGTKIIPRGRQGCATRDLSQTYWRVQTVVDGTHADLEDPYGGADPIAFDDQLNGLYVARIASTFSSQEITDSTVSNSRITVASTAGWTAGDWVRLFRTSTSAGERVVSLSHPTRVLGPASSGYGPVTRILDMPAAFGDANLVANPWLNTWTTAADAPDGYTRSTTYGTWSRDTSVLKIGTYSQKIVCSTTGGNTVTTRLYTGTATPYTTSGLRFCASAWVYIDTVSAALQRYVRIRIMKPDLSISYADGDYLDPAEIVGGWVRLSVQNVDLSAATAGVVVMTEIYVNNDPNGYAYHTSYFGPFTLSESDVPIEDVLFNGGIAMWQRANVLLNAISSPVAGYNVQLADLARLENSDWSDEPLVLGGNLEIVDSDLSVTTTQRVVEMTQDLLAPLNTSVQLQTAEPLLTTALAGTGGGSTISGAVSNVTVVAPAEKRTTIADHGITDVYTATEIDALLARKANIGAGGQGDGFPLTVGSIVYTSAGSDKNFASAAASAIFWVQPAGGTVAILDVIGYDDASVDVFWDVVVVYVFSLGYGVTVVSSNTVAGTPRARTYSMPASPQLAIGGAAGRNYVVRVAVRRTIATY